MAVTKDQVTFDVNIVLKDNLGSGVKSLSKELESIEKNVSSVEREIKSLEKSLSKDMGKNKGIETIKRDVRQLFFDINEASKQLKNKSIDIGTTDNFKMKS
jgi:predicted RNase H-like nuclease (RuvC/YqgF family)